MPSLETALRLFVIGQEFLIAVVFLFGSGNRTARISGSFLLVGTASYLLVSDTVLSEAVSVVLPLVILLAMIVPHCLWSFARAVFEAAWPKWWVSGFFVLVAVLVWLVFVGQDSYGAQWVDLADIVLHVASLVVVLHALLIVAQGLPDDLIERRRQFRVYFVVIISIQVGAVLIAELILRYAEPGWRDLLPDWLVLMNVFVIAILTNDEQLIFLV